MELRQTHVCLGLLFTLCVLFSMLHASVIQPNKPFEKIKKPLQQPRNDATLITAHIVSHSHCDPGWLVPAETYFDNAISKIIPNVIEYLSKDPTKRFVWAETSFLQMWYSRNNETMRAKLKKLIVDTKQLELVNNGWVMNDEACVDYTAIVNQMSEGHEYIRRTFGVVPQVGYSIDPFGASKVNTLFYSLMGFKYVILNRVDDRFKNSFDKINGSGTFQTEKSFEFYWQPSKSLGPKNTIFTHILDTHYSPPIYCNETCSGFDFEVGGDENPPVTSANLEERATLLAKILLEKSTWYRTSHLYVPFGNDFRYQRADLMFDNMDKLIAEINSKPQKYGIVLKYSTVSEYFEAALKESTQLGISFPLKTPDDGDFFPYTNCWKSDYDKYNSCIAYWSGYFTSYPDFKLLVRQAQSFLRSAELMYAIGFAERQALDKVSDWNQIFTQIVALRRAVALSMHHDAITGTDTLITRQDYTNQINTALSDLKSSLTRIVSALFIKYDSYPLSVSFDAAVINLVSQSRMIPITIFNNLAWSRNEYVSVLLTRKDVEVIDSDSGKEKKIPSQYIDRGNGNYELYFLADLPSLNFKTYFLRVRNISLEPEPETTPENSMKHDNSLQKELYLENESIKVKFVLSNEGLSLPYVLDSILNKETNTFVSISQQLLSYTSWQDGAYVFVPQAAAVPLNIFPSQVEFSYSNGTFVQELKQTLAGNLQQTFRIYNLMGDNPELSTVLDVETVTQNTGNNQEVILRFDTNIDSKGTFYTDGNSFEMIERQYQARFGDTTFPSMVSGNYYPVTNAISIKDASSQLTILTNQALGGSSQKPGSVELMINRNTLTDDGRGVGEPVNDNNVITTSIRLVVAAPSALESIRPRLSLLFEHKPLTLYFNTSSFEKDKGYDTILWAKYFRTIRPLVIAGEGLPNNIHLLNLQASADENDANDVPAVSDKFVLRLQHLYARGQDVIYSKEETLTEDSIINTKNYNFNILKRQSLTLLQDLEVYTPTDKDSETIYVHMEPLQIKTYQVEMGRNLPSTWFNLESFIIGLAAMMAAVVIISFVVFLLYQIVLMRSNQNKRTHYHYEEIQ